MAPAAQFFRQAFGLFVGLPARCPIDPTTSRTSHPTAFRIFFGIPRFTALASVPLAGAIVYAWHRRVEGLVARIHLTVLVTAVLLFPGFLRYWHLFGE